MLVTLLKFFEQFHSNHTQHQEVVANAIVHLIVSSINDDHTSLNDEPVEMRTMTQIKLLTSMLRPNLKSNVIETVISNVSTIFDHMWSYEYVSNMIK
jgi:hypothetical protein